MKTILIIIGIVSITFLEMKAQALSGLKLNPFVPTDTSAAARSKIDLIATFTYPKPQNVESVTMKIGNAAGQAQLSEVVVPIQQENGNYYTINKNGVYRINNNQILVKTSNMNYADLKGKYVTISLKLKDGSSSDTISIQY